MEENIRRKEAEAVAKLLTESELLLVSAFMRKLKASADYASKEDIEQTP